MVTTVLSQGINLAKKGGRRVEVEAVALDDCRRDCIWV